MKLQNLNDIFTNKILRIPDYQRGYAWKIEHVQAFWNDIIQLDDDKVHYTGVITLETASAVNYEKWESDKWIIEGEGEEGYDPYYIVDGQQRLTTAVILIQAILEKIEKVNVGMSVSERILIDSKDVNAIRDKYILFKASDGFKRSFLFGYEKDNPSDEFLRTNIFCEYSSSDLGQKTLYTENLRKSKNFFEEKLIGMNVQDIEKLFVKLTQKLKFNIYKVEDNLDVFVMFEAMNNRGKDLTYLELLKNRLIYLSTLFDGKTGMEVLRKNINDAWKTIYEYLGKDPENPLDDDDFLKNHWIMYFQTYTRQKGDDYIKFLLDREFTPRNVTNPEREDDRISPEYISNYVKSLQESVRFWFYIHNPYNDKVELLESKNEENKKWLEKMNRLGFRAFKPLLLSAYVSGQEIENINELLIVAERHNFIAFEISRRRATAGDSKFYGFATDMLWSPSDFFEIIGKIKNLTSISFIPQRFRDYIFDKYYTNVGFYDWSGLQYFLFEYECWLKERSMKYTTEISWDLFQQNKRDFVTIEHIYPQTDDDPYWEELFRSFSPAEKLYLLHSLGNLLPLSRSKNSAVLNYSFEIKKNNGDGVGYYNGSASENEIVEYFPVWNAQSIKKRGLELLKFMEERWRIEFESEEFKMELLHLTFLDEEGKRKEEEQEE